MARTLLFSAGLGLLVAWNWARLEQPRPTFGSLAVMVALGIAPALLPARRWRFAWEGIAVAAAEVAAIVAAGSIALGVRPYEIGRLTSRAAKGFLDFYDVLVPFDGGAHALMHGVLLLAVCVFSLLCALAVAGRRPLAASLALVAGAGWPATIMPGQDDLARGAILLAACLALVAWLRPEARRAPPQVLVGTGLVVLALIASGSSAFARDQFVAWQNWDFYNRPDKPVGVQYVWRSNYKGIHFPEKRTRVLTVHAPSRSAYWRATTLDAFADDNWDEELLTIDPISTAGRDDLSNDPFLPERARDPARWTRVDVRVEALRDSHVVSPSGPVAYSYPRGPIGGITYAAGGVALSSENLPRGAEYTAWGFQPQPKPAELARSRPDYPFEIAYYGAYLSVGRGPGRTVPPFGTPGREQVVAAELESYPEMNAYAPLYRTARRIAGKARNPYAATVALEAWLRSGGGFTYDETPPQIKTMPPLVAFVTQTQRGYCQHFAGAMALMLRYLGIPARVAAGFTSGAYEGDRGQWRVYDRNAHTWVEVWFRGYGWLPFDPTPSRGNLGGPYTSSSISFDAPGAEKVLAASALAARELLRFELGHPGLPGPGDLGAGVGDVGKGRGGSSGSKGGIGAGGVVGLATLGLALLFVGCKFALRRRRYFTNDPRLVASACRRELVEYLLDQGIVVPGSLSLGELRELARTRTGVDPRRLVDMLGLARFGPLSAAPAAAREARSELRKVRQRLRRALPARARLRGLFSIRSLLARA